VRQVVDPAQHAVPRWLDGFRQSHAPVLPHRITGPESLLAVQIALDNACSTGYSIALADRQFHIHRFQSLIAVAESVVLVFNWSY
jgi:hypothetical protein